MAIFLFALYYLTREDKRVSTVWPVGQSKTALAFDWPHPASGEIKLADNPLMKNYYIIFDGSGSMLERGCSGGRSKIAVAKESLRAFASLVPQDAQLGLMAFDMAGVSERVPLAAGNRKAFAAAANKISAGAGTPLKTAVAIGLQKLEEQAQKQLGYGEYHLVVVTDGMANPGEEPTPIVDEILRRTPIVMHTIGFCIGSNHTLNRPGFTIYSAAANAAELNAGLSEVLAEAASYDVASF